MTNPAQGPHAPSAPAGSVTSKDRLRTTVGKRRGKLAKGTRSILNYCQEVRATESRYTKTPAKTMRAWKVEKFLYCRCGLKQIRFKEQSSVGENCGAGKTKGLPLTKQ